MPAASLGLPDIDCAIRGLRESTTATPKRAGLGEQDAAKARRSLSYLLYANRYIAGSPLATAPVECEITRCASVLIKFSAATSALVSRKKNHPENVA